MTEKKTILSCKDVSIRYKVGDFKDIGLKEWVVRKLTGRYEELDFWADRHVSFELESGDMLGIIGMNGAGKSTLLKAISGIMEPTEGKIYREGNIAALLELTSGFDGDLTVKENTYLRGALLGYTREFMDANYKDILAFSELDDFENRPFKQLSTGMKSRLAFSIASLLHPDILILDEVLSVGDGAFRKKSEAKMHEIISGGATTILVSHSIDQIKKLCNKVLWLHKGNVIDFSDDVPLVCSRYAAFLANKAALLHFRPDGGHITSGHEYCVRMIGEPYGTLPTVVRDGHEMIEWADDSNNDFIIRKDTMVDNTATRTLIPLWERK